jgi:hypothetical protein
VATETPPQWAKLCTENHVALVYHTETLN